MLLAFAVEAVEVFQNTSSVKQGLSEYGAGPLRVIGTKSLGKAMRVSGLKTEITPFSHTETLKVFFRIFIFLGQGGLSAAPARAVSAVKNMNLPEIPRNINIGDINIKVPSLSPFWKSIPEEHCRAGEQRYWCGPPPPSSGYYGQPCFLLMHHESRGADAPLHSSLVTHVRDELWTVFWVVLCTCRRFLQLYDLHNNVKLDSVR